MRPLVLLSASGVLAAAIVFVACVGDDNIAPPTTGAAQGQLGGACFANGTCNAGLACTLENGVGTCTSPGGQPGPGPGTDAGSSDGSTTPTEAGPTTPPSCKFQTTAFPCGDPMPPNVCFGATQSCTLTGCNAGDIRWECNSPRQCGSVCCIKPANATLSAGANCTEGKLVMTVATVTGAECATALACEPDDIQLCQANSDCPSGQYCTPVKIAAAPASLNGNIVAVCKK